MKKASVIGSLVILLGLFIAITAVAEEQAIPHAPKPSTRMVPLRVVQPLNCVPGSTGCKPNLEYKKLWEVVDRTNTIYKPAGLQFWLKSVEYYYIPKIYMGNTADYRWDEFKHYSGQEDNILDIFPNMPADAYYDHDIKYMGLWLSNATALYGDPDELLVWLLWGGGGRMVNLRTTGVPLSSWAELVMTLEIASSLKDGQTPFLPMSLAISSGPYMLGILIRVRTQKPVVILARVINGITSTAKIPSISTRVARIA